MMGHYSYYYIDSPDDHDCMWSGDCCLISQTLIKQVVPDDATAVAVAVASGKLTQATATATLAGGGQQFAAVTATTSATADGDQQASLTETPANPQQQQSSTVASPTADTGASQQVTSTTSSNSSSTKSTTVANTRHGSKKSRQQHQQQQSGGGGGANEASRGQQVANKKLRHREVEKNRHRQLQAMVKNISERIPGRLDKETQVQTMKRAARYCLYLHDTMNYLLNHGQAQLQLQKIYLKAWDSVELMSQC